jgi:hypothetical protein
MRPCAIDLRLAFSILRTISSRHFRRGRARIRGQHVDPRRTPPTHAVESASGQNGRRGEALRAGEPFGLEAPVRLNRPNPTLVKKRRGHNRLRQTLSPCRFRHAPCKMPRYALARRLARPSRVSGPTVTIEVPLLVDRSNSRSTPLIPLIHRRRIRVLDIAVCRKQSIVKERY